VAWASLRFGSRERLDTVESETFDSAGRSCSTSRNSDPSATSDDKSAWGSTARRWRTPTDQTSTPESLTLQIGAGDITPQHQAARPIDRRVNRDPKTTPRMKSGRADPETRSRGCSHPHKAVGYRSPAGYNTD
jgi:hypothetical protein